MATQCGREIGEVRIGPSAKVGRAVRRPGRRLYTGAQRHRPSAGRGQRRLARPSENGLQTAVPGDNRKGCLGAAA
jgi:hypothetical protein